MLKDAAKLHEELLGLSLSQRHAKQKLVDGIAERLQTFHTAQRRLSRLSFFSHTLFELGSLQAGLSGATLLLSSVMGCTEEVPGQVRCLATLKRY